MSKLALFLLSVPLFFAYRFNLKSSRYDRILLESSRYSYEDEPKASDYSSPFYNLPTPLRADSQKVALKLLAVSRKVQKLAKKHSLEDLTRITGITKIKMDKIMRKAEVIEGKLLEVNLRLVHSIAVQHQGMGLELNDLVYEGVKGLKKALSRFDPEKGFAFSTYAYPWIREYIRLALASSLPIALPMHVYRLLVKVRAVQERLASLGRPPTDEEMAEELCISMERFEVVRRALALAEHSSDKTPALSDSARILIRFDEATWERIVATEKQGSVLEHVVSEQMQPQAQTEREQSEITGAVLMALNTLPEEESRAIHERLGLGTFSTTDIRTDKGTGVLKFSEMEIDTVAAKNLYQKGVRRLRRRAYDDKYPEMKVLQRLFNELQLSDSV
mmetsp:Transcript_29759/g.28456  ORF Transcript_29759/g.28456 Transcript_29759/m.28456 type:complete len:389 (+) Transcript_29759:113-1279(+)